MNKEQLQNLYETAVKQLDDYKKKEPEKFFKYRTLSTIVLCTFLLLFILNITSPEAEKKPVKEAIVQVEILKVKAMPYPITIDSSGTVEAVTRSNLVAQVQGQIVNVSDAFKTGGVFKKGDVLLEIDARDYQANLSSALATLSQAEANLKQEQANSKQAQRDWKRLGYTEAPSDLVLRKPQLAAAKAQYDSAKAAYDFANLQLSRTKIAAPYNGRLISKQADLGQFVGVGTVLAEAFASDAIEVKLPLSQTEFAQLDLDTNTQKTTFPNVTLISRFAGKQHQWQAKITRSDSSFNTTTRQINVIATIDNPFAKTDSDKPTLKIGQFVDAVIQGRVIQNAFVVPNTSMREGNFLYVVDNNVLAKREVSIVWQDNKNTVISEGLKNDDNVVLTALSGSIAGTKANITNIKVAGEKKDRTQQSKENNSSGKHT